MKYSGEYKEWVLYEKLESHYTISANADMATA